MGAASNATNIGVVNMMTPALASEAYEHGAHEVGFADAVGSALGLLVGLRVVPWTSIWQTSNHAGQGFMQHAPVEERPFDHECIEARRLRSEDVECGDVEHLWTPCELAQGAVS